MMHPERPGREYDGLGGLLRVGRRPGLHSLARRLHGAERRPPGAGQQSVPDRTP